jgi:hypothetical protein
MLILMESSGRTCLKMEAADLCETSASALGCRESVKWPNLRNKNLGLAGCHAVSSGNSGSAVLGLGVPSFGKLLPKFRRTG